MHSPRSETGLKSEMGPKSGLLRFGWRVKSPQLLFWKSSRNYFKGFFCLKFLRGSGCNRFCRILHHNNWSQDGVKTFEGQESSKYFPFFQHPHIWVDGNIKYKIVNFATLSPTVHINLCQLLHGDSFFEHRWK